MCKHKMYKSIYDKMMIHCVGSKEEKEVETKKR